MGLKGPLWNGENKYFTSGKFVWGSVGQLVLNRRLLGTVCREHHCATWDGNNANPLQRQCACHKSFKSSLTQSEKVPEGGKPWGCTLIWPGLSLLIRASEANEEKTLSFKTQAQPYGTLINVNCWKLQRHCKGLKSCTILFGFFILHLAKGLILWTHVLLRCP